MAFAQFYAARTRARCLLYSYQAHYQVRHCIASVSPNSTGRITHYYVSYVDPDSYRIGYFLISPETAYVVQRRTRTGGIAGVRGSNGLDISRPIAWYAFSLRILNSIDVLSPAFPAMYRQ
jgi:hypothetical protein